MFYAVDRFEGSLALLEDDEGTIHRVDREQLPAGVRESDVLRLEGNRYLLDTEERDRRKEAVRRLQEQLRRKK